MNRLTKKVIIYPESRKDGTIIKLEGIVPTYKGDIYKKLYELENIEEELNIDIVKAVNLCKQVNKNRVVYTKQKWGIEALKILDDLDVELFNHRLYVSARGMYVSLDLYEYGKDWALTIEELEKWKD